MTADMRVLVGALSLLGCFLCVETTHSLAGDEHTVESLIHALQSPIPEQAAKQAQDEDARTLSSGRDAKGRQIRHVVDDQSRVVSMIARQLLNAMSEDDQKWTVRVLDTAPPVIEATVSGGTFIYVYTGLPNQAPSKDDIAFVLAHELGHFLLKHNRAPHTLLEEREADALAAVISTKAGFDAYHGANFVVTGASRLGLLQAQSAQHKNIIGPQRQKLARLCAQMRQGSLDSAPSGPDPDRRKQTEAICNSSKQLEQFDKDAYQLEDRLTPGGFHGDHPTEPGRATAVDGLANYLTGRGDIDSAEQYEPSFRVLVALAASDSPLLPPSVKYSAELLKVAKPYSSSVSRQPSEGNAQLDALVKQQRYNEIANILSAQDQSVAQFLPWLRQQAEAGHVPLQFELSKYLASSNPTEALSWFAIARIGATLDAALCQDKTAGSGVSALIMFYGQHIRSAMEEKRYRVALEQGLQWHDDHPVRPSPFWICVHGMQAFVGQVRLIPESQWRVVQQETKQKMRLSLHQIGKAAQ